MIITRTPLRIPLGGGGTDLPEFYKRHGSFFITTAIDYYIYIAVKHRSIKGIRLAYSQVEEIQKINDIEHPIIKAALKYLKVDISNGLEIVSIGDLPAGTGMGSSGCFTVGLLNALYHLQNAGKSPIALAKDACHINMDVLREPSGPQDEYSTAFGGFMCFEISKRGIIKAYPLNISRETQAKLENNLLIFYTGIRRKSSKALDIQRSKLEHDDKDALENLLKIKEIGIRIKEALENGNTRLFGKLLDDHWNVKRKRAFTSSAEIDRWYAIAKSNGALGGKIMGAGGGGFFAFYCERGKESLVSALTKEGLQKLTFNFTENGTRLLMNA